MGLDKAQSTVSFYAKSWSRSLCADYHEQRGPPDDRRWRPLVRIVLVTILAALVVAFFVVRYEMKETFYTTRVYARDFKEKSSEFKKMFELDAAGKVTDLKQGADDTVGHASCPCKEGVLPWRKFTSIFALNYDKKLNTSTRIIDMVDPSNRDIEDQTASADPFTDQILDAPKSPGLVRYCKYVHGYMLKKFTWIVSENAQEVFSNACFNLLTPLTTSYPMNDCIHDKSCSHRTLISPVLMNREQFVAEIVRKMVLVLSASEIDLGEGWVTQEVFNRVVKVVPDNQTAFTYEIVRHIAYPFHRNLLEYPTAVRQGLDGKKADKEQGYRMVYTLSRTGYDYENWKMPLAVEIKWEKYFEACGPPYCELVLEYSKRWRVFNVFVEIGSVLSLALFALQAVIWPWACMLLPLGGAPLPAVHSNPTPFEPV